MNNINLTNDTVLVKKDSVIQYLKNWQCGLYNSNESNLLGTLIEGINRQQIVSYKEIKKEIINEFVERLMVKFTENSCEATINNINNVDFLLLDTIIDIVSEVSEEYSNI